MQKALAENGFAKPFPIQEAAIPLILQGKDIIGQAHTGTGKTAAFALPLLTKIRNNSNRSIQALVLVPTRELAAQVTNEIMKFSKHMQIWTVSIYGGQSFGLQAGLIEGRPDSGCHTRKADGSYEEGLGKVGCRKVCRPR